GRRQPPARLTWRTWLNHYRGRRITLLCARSRAEEICRSARCQQQTAQHCKCSCRPELALAAKTIQPTVWTIAKHSFGFDESLSRNTNILRDSLQADGSRHHGGNRHT